MKRSTPRAVPIPRRWSRRWQFTTICSPTRRTNPPFSTACNTSAAPRSNNFPTKRTLTKKREKQAFQAYHSVLETDHRPAGVGILRALRIPRPRPARKSPTLAGRHQCCQKNRLVQRSARRRGRHPRQPARSQIPGLVIDPFPNPIPSLHMPNLLITGISGRMGQAVLQAATASRASPSPPPMTPGEDLDAAIVQGHLRHRLHHPFLHHHASSRPR